MTLKHVLKHFSKTEVQEDKTHPTPPLKKEGVKVSCVKHTVKNFLSFISHFSQLCTPHPSPVLNLLHAHRISLFAHSCTSLNLFAIRTRFTPSVRKSALPQGAREQLSCAEHTEKHLFSYSPIHLFTFKKVAFTLAEVLITLAIIGVVAALTLPTLIQNHKKQTYVNQLKKVVNTLENAAQLAVAQEGVSSFKDTTLFNAMNDIYFCTYAEESVFCKQDVVKHYFKLLDLNYEISTSKYKSFQNPSTLISVMGVGTANMHLPNGAILYFQGGGNSVVFDIDVNGATAPNQEGYDFYRLQLSQTGTIKDHYCNTEIESEYLQKGCFYKKIVSDGWKMDY